MTYTYLNYDSSNYSVDINVPGVPTALYATSGNTQSLINWTAPSNNGGSAIIDYVVQYSLDDSSWTTFADGVTTSTSATITGLVNGILYYFRVRAQNIAGYSSYTTSVTATPASDSGSTKKKLIFNKKISKIGFSTRVKGTLKNPQIIEVKVFGNGFSLVESLVRFNGIVQLISTNKIQGKSKLPILQEYKIQGKSKLPVVQEILVTGRKDFTSLIGVLNKYIQDKEPQGYLKRIVESITS